MKIFLTGYMGSGKSLVGKKLAAALNYDFLDLDDHIEILSSQTIHEIFEKKGELYFRNLETRVLKDVLEETANMVISLGGGTPCYGNNFDMIREAANTKTVYLKASVENLTSRLFAEKLHRPVISHLETREALEEFIRKHLFERAFYYNQSEIIINVDQKTPEEIVRELSEKLTE